MQCRKAEILPLPQKTSPVYLVSTLGFTEIGTDRIEVPHSSESSPSVHEPPLVFLPYRRTGCQELSPFSPILMPCSSAYCHLPQSQTLNSRPLLNVLTGVLLSRRRKCPGPRSPHMSSSPDILHHSQSPQTKCGFLHPCCWFPNNCHLGGGLETLSPDTAPVLSPAEASNCESAKKGALCEEKAGRPSAAPRLTHHLSMGVLRCTLYGW